MFLLQVLVRTKILLRMYIIIENEGISNKLQKLCLDRFRAKYSIDYSVLDVL